MKFNKWTLGLAAVASLALFTPSIVSAQAQYYAPQGLYIDGANDSVINAGGTAYTNDVILAATTNYFNLSPIPGNQSNTNLWPAFSLTQWGVDSRYVGADVFFNCGGANPGVVTFNWVPSDDGTHWLTNQPIIETITANGTTFTSGGTNADLGGHPFLDLYSEANTNTSTFITNLDIELASKPGL